MHAFSATLPETCPHPTGGPAVLVICGCQPGRNDFYCLVGTSDHLLQKPRLERRNLPLADLLRWFTQLGIVWPGGLPEQLQRDAQCPIDQPWRCYFWREQGPELINEFPSLSQRATSSTSSCLTSSGFSQN